MGELVNLTSKTDSTAIFTIIVIAIVIIVLVKQVYPVLAKARKARRQEEMEMTNRVITVVEKNTEAYTKLAVIIESTDKNCHECKLEQSDKMDRVLDAVHELTRTTETLTSMQANLYRILVERGEINPDEAKEVYHEKEKDKLEKKTY